MGVYRSEGVAGSAHVFMSHHAFFIFYSFPFNGQISIPDVADELELECERRQMLDDRLVEENMDPDEVTPTHDKGKLEQDTVAVQYQLEP